MADDLITLSNRLLSQAPSIGILLARQFISDSYRTLESRREWSWRRKSGIFAPPDIYSTGQVTTNVAAGNPTTITGIGTTWTPDMVGRQIRIGGLLYPYYDVVGYLSATSLLLDRPWAGPDVVTQSYYILQVYYPVPDTFGYFYSVVSIKDALRLSITATESDLNVFDPQRTMLSQTYAVVFKDYSPIYGGVVGPVIGTTPGNPVPTSTTMTGYNYPGNSTYVIQVNVGGATGTATWSWLKAGQTAFTGPFPSSTDPTDLADGVQVFWPLAQNYVVNDIYIINAQSMVGSGARRYELWPGPTFSGYLYPYIYITKESDLTVQNPALPSPIASRGEILLEMGLEKACMFPGQDENHMNLSYSMKDALYHASKVKEMLVDLERNDEELTIGNIDYQGFPQVYGPWATGNWQQRHSPWLGSV